MKISRSLIDNRPMAIDKGLATVFGLDLAALLQEVHFSVTAKEMSPHKYKASLKDGYFWYYDTKANIHESMPFLGSVKTIQRLISKGKEMGVLVVGEYNKMPGDNTNWFRINHIILNQKMEAHYAKQNPDRYVNPDLNHSTPGQIDPTPRTNCPSPQDKLTPPPGQIDPTNTIDFSETSSETSSESKSPRKRKQPSPTISFNDFYSLYPKKRKRQDAENAWAKLTEEQMRLAIADMRKDRAYRDSEWLDKGGKFIPLPSTYLNGKRWEDEWEPPSCLQESTAGQTINVSPLPVDNVGNSPAIYQHDNEDYSAIINRPLFGGETI